MCHGSLPLVLAGLAARAGLVVALAAGCLAAHAGEARVAVATNFLKAMQALAPAFTAATGHTASISAGSTGKRYSPVGAGARVDVLLVAVVAPPAPRLGD